MEQFVECENRAATALILLSWCLAVWRTEKAGWAYEASADTSTAAAEGVVAGVFCIENLTCWLVMQA